MSLEVYDLIGIGFGPSNIALAIALDERMPKHTSLQSLYIEKHPEFAWHPGLLLNGTDMQISFLKDLATMRNPTSRFTFINYLHEKGRLQEFINLKTFYPSRHEFSDYLGWAAAFFKDRCVYGEEVFELAVEKDGSDVKAVRVRSRDSKGNVQERLASNLVISVGGVPHIPEMFKPFMSDGRISHSHHYLHNNIQAKKIAVIGAGQSAAEVFVDLDAKSCLPQVDLIMRAQALKPSDDTPFVNEVFNVEFIDHVFSLTQEERDDLLREFRHTNYACPDRDLIEQLYKIFYEQKVRNEVRHRLLRHRVIKSVNLSGDGVELCLLDTYEGKEEKTCYDAVILATGYERHQHKALLEPLKPYFKDFNVDRYYRLQSTPDFHPAVFLQGVNEPTHGLSDTLLSVTAVRTGEIADLLLSALTKQDA